MGKFCIYSDTQVDAPCITIPMYKYSYLDNFISDKKNVKGIEKRSVPLKISCLKLRNDSTSKFEIKHETCINCMFCVFGCCGNKILLSKRLHPLKFCYDISQEEISELRILVDKLFKGEFIKLPKVPLSQFTVRYKSFENFTAIRETENIAVWTANAMKYLSLSLEPRIALEVGLEIQERNRGGRLDVSLFNTKDNYLFVAETKVDFSHMMSEGRYESQMVAYETELENVSQNIKRSKFLVIGGKESDLIPCGKEGSTCGQKGLLFYKVLREHKLFFFTANALLALGVKKLYDSIQKYSLENLHPIITNDKFVGILSAGVVTSDENIISLDEALKMI